MKRETILDTLWTLILVFGGMVVGMILAIKLQKSDVHVIDGEKVTLRQTIDSLQHECDANYAIACNLSDIISHHIDIIDVDKEEIELDSLFKDFIINHNDYNVSLPSHFDNIDDSCLVDSFVYYYTWWY